MKLDYRKVAKSLDGATEWGEWVVVVSGRVWNWMGSKNHFKKIKIVILFLILFLFLRL